MGAILSCKNKSSDLYEGPHGGQSKRQRTSMSFLEENPRLIPSLPDEISIQILARLPRISYLGAKSVSRSWKLAILSPELYKVRKELETTEEWLYVLTRDKNDKLTWHALDPISKRWQRLPPMPNVNGEESKRVLPGLRSWNIVGPRASISDTIRGWFGKKYILGKAPFSGCSLGSVDGSIYVIGGFSKASATNCVLCYDPIFNTWNEVNPMSVGRAYAKIGVLNKKLYTVGGVTKGRGGLAPLQSAEVFDPCTGIWSEIPNMPFSKAQVLPTAFLADLLKPIATGMASYKGKLYVAQSLYCWPFFVDVGGEVYDPETNVWTEMPSGMGEGWPARQAGMKMNVIVDGDLYALDPSSSVNGAKVKVYDHEDDVWRVINGDLPMVDFESLCLLAGFHKKLHVINIDAGRNILVMQARRESDASSVGSTSSSTPPGGSSVGSTSSSTSPSGSSVGSTSPGGSSARTVGTTVWKVLASRSAGSEELVNCQILDI